MGPVESTSDEKMDVSWSRPDKDTLSRVKNITRETKDVIFYEQGAEIWARPQTGWLVVIDEDVVWFADVHFPASPELRVVICQPTGRFWKNVDEYPVTADYRRDHTKPGNEDAFIFLQKKDAAGKWVGVSGAVGNSSFELFPDGGHGHNGVYISWVSPQGQVNFGAY
jgi:hypothetical protein